MSEEKTSLSGLTLIAIPVGRNGWISKEVTLHYEAGRLVKAEGVEFAQTGPQGLTGTLYVVKDSPRYDNRMFMRIERQKIVNGKVVDSRNWGEIEQTMPRAA
jgi:hypothetical protein